MSDDPAASREQQLADLHAWLDRLVGRFEARTQMTGRDMGPIELGSGRLVHSDPPLLHRLHCAPVGSGPGVNCLFEATERTTGPMSLALLFGIDANQLGIRFLWLDASGHARVGFGELKNDTVVLRSPCGASSSCVGDRTLRVRAPASARIVEMQMEANVRMSSATFRTFADGWTTVLQRQ